MISPRILIAGIGNIFLGDDAFGVEVVRLLGKRSLAPEVRVADFGIRGIDLVYALTDELECAIMIDAVNRGGPPGTLYLIEPTLQDACEPQTSIMEAHDLDPLKVLRIARSMGSLCRRVLLVGCEGRIAHDDDAAPKMSDEVCRAIPEAAAMVESLIVDILAGNGSPGGMAMQGDRI